ncbi:diguanylate cyclase domain-containing protein [Pseudomonas aeruginosa]
MKSRNWLNWLLSVFLTVGFSSVYLFSKEIILTHCNFEDKKKLKEQAKLLQETLNIELKKHIRLTNSFAWSYTNRDYMSHSNRFSLKRSYITRKNSINALDLDFNIVLNSQGRLLLQRWGHRITPKQKKAIIDFLLLRKIILINQDRDTPPKVVELSKYLTGFHIANKTPILLAIAPLKSSDIIRLTNGIIISGKIIDKKKLKKRIGATITITNLKKSNDIWSILPGINEAESVTYISHQKLKNNTTQLISLRYVHAQSPQQIQFNIESFREFNIKGRKIIVLLLLAILSATLASILIINLNLENYKLKSTRKPRISKLPCKNKVKFNYADNFQKTFKYDRDKKATTRENSLTKEPNESKIIQSIIDGYFEVNGNGIITSVNPALCRLLGYSDDSILGKSYHHYLSHSHKLNFSLRHHWRIIKNNTGNTFTSALIRADGSIGFFETAISIIDSTKGSGFSYHGIIRDVTDRIFYQNQLIEMAYYDELTKLGNRKALEDNLETALNKAKNNQTKFAILYLDLDHFKKVNDIFGHNIGDQLLIAVANRIRNCLREKDKAYRLGGDEFLILIEDIKTNQPQQLANRLLLALSDPILVGIEKVDFITFSIGIAIYPDNSNDIKSLINAADSAMYLAKEKRNSYRLAE